MNTYVMQYRKLLEEKNEYSTYVHHTWNFGAWDWHKQSWFNDRQWHTPKIERICFIFLIVIVVAANVFNCATWTIQSSSKRKIQTENNTHHPYRKEAIWDTLTKRSKNPSTFVSVSETIQRPTWPIERKRHLLGHCTIRYGR